MTSDPNKSPGLHGTMDEWFRFIQYQWSMSVGYNPYLCPDNHPEEWLPTPVPSPPFDESSSYPLGFHWYWAVLDYRLAMDKKCNQEDREDHLLASAESAGCFVRGVIESGNLERIRYLYLALKRIEKGAKSRFEGHANDQVGQALMNFIYVNKRLPDSREDLRNGPKQSDAFNYDLASVTPRNLSEALVYYELNERIRDKTGPKPS